MKKAIYLTACLLTMSQGYASELGWNNRAGTNFTELTAGTNLYYLGFASPSGVSGGAGIEGVSLGLAFGHHFTDVFALEGGFLQAIADVHDGSRINAPYISTRFVVPMTERTSFIGKLGAMYPYIPGGGESTILPFTGVGVSYAATQKVDLSLQYQGAVYGIAGAGTAGVGLTYRFD